MFNFQIFSNDKTRLPPHRPHHHHFANIQPPPSSSRMMYSDYYQSSGDELEDAYHGLEDDVTCDEVPVKNVDTCDVSGVLLALEKAMRMPNFRRVEFQKVFKLENWETFQNVYGGDKDPFEGNADGHVVDPAWVKRLKISSDQTDDAVRMLKALLELASQLQRRFKASRKRIVAAKRSKGIKSLPDEIVAKIFQLAVEGDDEGGRQAKWISQTSRRFRNIAFGTRSLWTTLHSRYSRSDVELAIRQAGPDAEFHVYVDLNLLSKMRTFIHSCRPIVPHWKTLTLVYDKDYGTVGGVSDALGELSSLLGNGSRSLKLEQIFLRSGGIMNAVSTINANWPDNIQLWAPNLRTLRCSWFLPIPSIPLSSISTLVVMHNFYSRINIPSVRSLLKLLTKLPNVTDFTLEPDSIEHPFGNETLPVTECPSIKSFQLRLRYFPLKDFTANGSCLAILMDALRMPSLEEYSICIGIDDYYGTDKKSESAKWTQSLGHLSSAMLPTHLSNSPHKKSLVYKLLFMRYQPDEAPPDSKILNIPFDAIRGNPSVTISSFVRVLFSQRADDDLLRTLPIERNQLRELKLIGCGYMTSLDLRCTVDSLKLHGVWSDIERVVVQDCAHITREDAMSVIGEERLQYLEGHVTLERSRTMCYNIRDE
ncbi:hypothetical protein SCHPADRAFT_893851 [Schizopora paradoxa]|uniref:Uncharacterized protein n=1 Tax=Schizopora paradoxa TaxID=27342 RepID=A0A0H2RUJ0_9AGAM|nr:hypothetical protein SCHPADRAFT_893851 [Schizopora paradoxa]